MPTCILIAAEVCCLNSDLRFLSNLASSNRTCRSLSFELRPPKSTLFRDEESPVKNIIRKNRELALNYHWIRSKINKFLKIRSFLHGIWSKLRVRNRQNQSNDLKKTNRTCNFNGPGLIRWKNWEREAREGTTATKKIVWESSIPK